MTFEPVQFLDDVGKRDFVVEYEDSDGFTREMIIKERTINKAILKFHRIYPELVFKGIHSDVDM